MFCVSAPLTQSVQQNTRTLGGWAPSAAAAAAPGMNARAKSLARRDFPMPGLPLMSSKLSPVSGVRNPMQSRTAFLMGKYNLPHRLDVR